MSKYDELFAGLQKEADNRRFFLERAGDYVTFKKMAAGPESSESGGTPLEDQPQPHAETHCPGCSKERTQCSCESAVKEAEDKTFGPVTQSEWDALTPAQASQAKRNLSWQLPLVGATGVGAGYGALKGTSKLLSKAPGKLRIPAAGLAALVGGIGTTTAAGHGLAALNRKRNPELFKKEKKAMAYLPANPASADSSVNAQLGELSAVEKTALSLAPLKAVVAPAASVGKAVMPAASAAGKTVARNPYLREAAIWGGAGATAGALTAPPGHRAQAAIKHGLTGAAGGAVASGIGRGLSKLADDSGTNHDMRDLKGRAADRYPVSEVPSLPDELLAVAEAAKKKVIGAKKMRSELVGGKKPRSVTSPIPVPEKYKAASLAAAKSFMTAKNAPIIGLAALGLGAANYFAARPQADLGGRSGAEHELQQDVLSNKGKARKDDGLPTRLRHRMKEFQSGLATDFRKSPAAAGAAGALGGAALGATLVKVLGGLR